MSQEKYIEDNKLAYDKISEPFSSTREYLWEDLLPLKKYTKDGSTVLDVGSGAGRLYQLFEDLSIDYTGVDQSKEQIEVAKKNYPEGNFVLAEMSTLPFEEQSFDIIYCIATFHHLPTHESRIRSLLEMKRVLVSGGKIIMTNWNLDSEYAKRKLGEDKWRFGESEDHVIIPWRVGSGDIVAERHYWRLSQEYLEELFREVGLEIIDQYFSTRGEKSDIEKGDNVVSVLEI